MVPSEKKPTQKKKGSWVKDIFMIFIMALALALFVKTFLVDSRVVPTASMYPTIEVGDRVLVNKLSYIADRAPQRGDIVVFKAPEEMHSRSDLLKRVIGLPGETVYIHDGTVYIDDVPLEEEYLNERPNYEYGPVTVPDGCYFMLGDNRNNSLDSHRWQEAFTPEEDIKGKVFFRYWPLYRIGEIDG